MSIYVLTIVNSEEDSSDLYFTTYEKAYDFIFNNYNDNIRKISNEFFEGKERQYFINSWAVDQERL